MLSVLRPLKDRAVLTVWSGLCTSTIGDTQLGCGLLILNVGVAGNLLCRRIERRERRGHAAPAPSE